MYSANDLQNLFLCSLQSLFSFTTPGSPSFPKESQSQVQSNSEGQEYTQRKGSSSSPVLSIATRLSLLHP